MTVDDIERISAEEFGVEYFDEYQDLVEAMPLYDDPILGLVGETGEVVEHIKKSRRNGGRAKPLDLEKFKLELGDVLWYLTRLASEHGIELRSIATDNIEKLRVRHREDEGQLGIAF